MAKRYGLLEADEPQTAEPRTHVPKSAARYLLRKLLAVQIEGRERIIQMVKLTIHEVRQAARAFWDGPLGIGNAVPFSRRTDPTHHFNYPVGPTGIRRWGYFRRYEKDEGRGLHTRVIKVSARPQSHLAAQFTRRTQPLTLDGSPNALSLAAQAIPTA